jgi:hypothetical protein
MRTLGFKMFLILATTGLFISCSKENTPPSTPPPAPKSRLELFTGVTWKYEEYHTGYNTSNTLLAYKAGKPNNTMNLDGVKVKFNTDGTEQEWQANGTILPGTWKFLNDSTQYQVINSAGTFLTTIVSLDEKNFFWTDLSRLNGVYARMVPVP